MRQRRVEGERAAQRIGADAQDQGSSEPAAEGTSAPDGSGVANASNHP